MNVDASANSTIAAGKATSDPISAGDPEPTIFELSRPGRSAYSIPDPDVPGDVARLIPAAALATEVLPLPEVSERDLVAHFTRLAHRQYSVDAGAYPLGSCTMKYNPKVAEQIAALEGFASLHPSAPESIAQGSLALMFRLEQAICAITGMARATLQPPAGAAGELTGLLIMRAWHEQEGEVRSKVLIPDSAHGTNPASVTLAGYETVQVPSGPDGLVDVDALRSIVDDDVAGLMLTNPNTLGLFEMRIREIAAIVHDSGGLVYYDGANLNAILGICRPGDMGFDIVHSNLHKTFATPHGGGGPGAGPVAVTSRLVDFLPGPIPTYDADADAYGLEMPAKSIGRIHSHYGNFGILVRALAYMAANGPDGLRSVAEMAVLNARFLQSLIASDYEMPYSGPCMHEFVASAAGLKSANGVRALDVGKRLLDKGFHAPTVYFPLVVDEAMMFEPTETESLETVAALAGALIEIANEAVADPDMVKSAPHTTPVRRPDEARASNPKTRRLTWEDRV